MPTRGDRRPQAAPDDTAAEAAVRELEGTAAGMLVGEDASTFDADKFNAAAKAAAIVGLGAAADFSDQLAAVHTAAKADVDAAWTAVSAGSNPPTTLWTPPRPRGVGGAAAAGRVPPRVAAVAGG